MVFGEVNRDKIVELSRESDQLHSNLIPLMDSLNEECNIDDEELKESPCVKAHHKAEEMKNTHMKANEGLWYINEAKEKRILICKDN